MLKKTKTVYVCSECGLESPRWFGKCPECGSWNTLNEELRQPEASRTMDRGSGKALEPAVSSLNSYHIEDEMRRKTGLSELDRVLGGGVVSGSVILLAGDPGIGKSTILLQVCQSVENTSKILYIAGEESPRQIKLRAGRLGVKSDNLYIASVTDTERAAQIIEQETPDIVMVDSIQTMTLSALHSSAGSVSQVRESTQMLIRVAKSREIPIFIVGHVNKDGAIAGPKVLEHMVDVVLYFEGDRQSAFRILRAAKNRFGSTNEIGVFEMGEEGLTDVPNPSQMFLSGRPDNVSGTCVACVMEGSRPILAEVQALVSKTGFGTPRRMSTGFDYNRMALLLAVLEKRGGYFFGNLDTYVNVVGGFRLDEPAADLPVAMALISNLLDRQVPDHLAAFGEIGLAGELRGIPAVETRINESFRLGFTKIVLPNSCIKRLQIDRFDGLELVGAKNISEAFAAVFGRR